jgi:hypothetical protein
MKGIINGQGNETAKRIGVMALGFALPLPAIDAGVTAGAGLVAADETIQVVASDTWDIRLGSYVWMSDIESTVTTNGTTIDTKLRFSDILDDLVTGGVVYAEGRKGMWGFQFDGVYLVTRDSFGVESVWFSNEVEQLVLEAAASYTLLEESEKTLTLLGGLRYTDMTTTIGINFLSIEDKHEWLEPFAAIRFRRKLSAKWTFGARAHVGGFGLGSEFTGGAQIILAYAANQDLDLGIGVRYQYLDYQDGTYRMEAHMFGPIVGMTYRF